MKKKQKGQNKRFWFLGKEMFYSLLITALLLMNGVAQYALWFGKQGVVLWQKTEQKYIAVEHEISTVKKRIQLIEEEILLSQKEKGAFILEEIARNALGLVYPDEILFVFPENNNDS